MPGAKTDGEQEVVYHLHTGEKPLPDQLPPIISFVAGTPVLTPQGHKPIEDLPPSDLI